MNIIDILESVGISGFLDIVFMSVVIYSVLVWFKQTKAAFVVIGMFILGGAYLLARQLDLSLTISVFQGFFAIIIIAVVIIFQEEIKHFLEQLASRNIVTRLRARNRPPELSPEIQALVAAVFSLADNKVGALIVVQGKDPLARHLEGGIDLRGALSEPLLRSLFETTSPSHDGAVIISGGTISKFSCYLPLSQDLEKLRKMGTRHAAALGLAELTDAFCIVVSEQRGTVSVTRNGNIRPAKSAEELAGLLNQFYRETIPSRDSKAWKEFFKKNYREKAIAIGATVVLWFFLVHESKIDYRTYSIPIEFNSVASQLQVQSVNPSEVEVTFSAPRRSFYFVNTKSIKVDVKLFDVARGSATRSITRSNITCPEGLTVENIQPSSVTFTIVRLPQ